MSVLCVTLQCFQRKGMAKCHFKPNFLCKKMLSKVQLLIYVNKSGNKDDFLQEK